MANKITLIVLILFGNIMTTLGINLPNIIPIINGDSDDTYYICDGKDFGCSSFNAIQKIKKYTPTINTSTVNTSTVNRSIKTCGLNSYLNTLGKCICYKGYIWKYPNDPHNLDCIKKIIVGI